MKKALSLLVVLAMVISMVPSVFAAESGPVISKQPESVQIDVDATAIFTVEATGNDLTYQWQYLLPNNKTWRDTTMSGYDSATLTVGGKLSRNAYQYRCVITDANGKKATSDAATLLVGPQTDLKFTEQPTIAIKPLGEFATFHVAVEGSASGWTYQWEYKLPTNEYWRVTTMEGNTTDTLIVESKESRDRYQYRCVVTDSDTGATVTSDAAALYVGTYTEPTITAQPVSATILSTETATYTVAVEGTGLSYQWQYNLGTGWYNTSMPGNTTDTMTVEGKPSRNGYQYRCVITDALGVEIITDVVTITINANVTINTQPVSAEAVVGEVVYFVVDATSDGDITYQWQYLLPNNPVWRTTTMEGNTTNTLIVEGKTSRNGYQYRCVITDAQGAAAISEAATLHVVADAVITEQPADASIYIDEVATFHVGATSTGALSYQWQYLLPGTTTWRNTTMQGNTTDTMTVEGKISRNGYQYRCVITDANGLQVISDAVTFTVTEKPAITITSQPESAVVELGVNAVYTVVAEADAALSYQWQYLLPGDTTWRTTSMPGNQTAEMTVEGKLSRDGYQYRCVITDANGKKIISDVVSLTILGTETNPMYPEYTWNDAQSEATATVTVPAGTTLYYGVYAGMELTVNGESKGVLTDRIYAITNNGAASAEYVLVLSTPLGMEGNPEVIEDMTYFMDSVSIKESAGYSSDAYFYSYTAPADGTITLYITEITEGVTGDIVVRSDNWDVWSLQADGEDNYGLELKVDVVEGETYLIWVETAAIGMYEYPAADITWAGSFKYPAGSEQNPIYPEYTWNDAQSEATVTVTVPAGETVYYGVFAGMELSVNGEAKGVLTADTYAITNEGEEAAEYVLVLSTPLGEDGNPVVIEDMSYYVGSASLDAVSGGYFSDAYYYSYTAPADGTITLYITEITEGVTGDIIVRNDSWDVWSLQADGEDNYGLELKVDVVEGETYLIWVETAPIGMYEYPAAEISWVGSFTYPAGSEQNPIYPEYTWNDAQSEATVTVTVPAGETVYYGVYAGMELSVNGEAKGLLTAATYAITNEGEEAAEYVLVMTTPLGEEGNPVVIEGNTYTGSANLEASSDISSDAYYYSFTAPADGTITLSITEITENVTGNIVVRTANWETWSVLGEGVEGVLTVDVVAGETYLIYVETQAIGMYQYPAADITWDFSFVEEVTTDTEIENPVAPNPDNGEE